jgi:hypothetical protein
LIVKPDPMQETLDMRNKLKQVGSDARDEEGKSHYRFYCYTDPSPIAKLVDLRRVSAGLS